jgi:hypothetical protein
MQTATRPSRKCNVSIALRAFGLLVLLHGTAGGFEGETPPPDANTAPAPKIKPHPQTSDGQAAPVKKPAILLRPHVAAPAQTAVGAGVLKLVPFTNSPFPYDGDIPEQNKPFLDAVSGDRRGHTSPRGGVHWVDETYSDQRVLLYVPKTFDIHRPAVIVVFFHGNLATLDRDVIHRQQVPRQMLESGLNAVLIAPQFAVNALDSSAGHFWEKGFFAKFLGEADARLAQATGLPSDGFRSLPVVIVAYSGGYLPAAYALDVGGANSRVRGLILMDALYGEIDRFADWVGSNWQRTFFLSAYSRSSASQNARLRSILGVNSVSMKTGLPNGLGEGTVAFLAAGDNVVHNDFVTHAWANDPLKIALSRIEGFHHAAVPARDPVPLLSGQNRP